MFLAWKNNISGILGNHLGLQSSLYGPDFWFKVATGDIGNEYYSYILVYVDDFLIVDKDPRKNISVLESKYMMKPSSIGGGKVYLGDDFGELWYGDGSYAWTMRSDSYVKEVVNNVKKRLKEDGL